MLERGLSRTVRHGTIGTRIACGLKMVIRRNGKTGRCKERGYGSMPIIRQMKKRKEEEVEKEDNLSEWATITSFEKTKGY